jgi:phosphatidylglycerophosphate synthase
MERAVDAGIVSAAPTVHQYSLRDAVRPPGLISLARLPLSLAFVWAARKPGWALAVLGAAAATDVLDGWVARRGHQETPTGAILDGLMDKAFVLVVVLTLVLEHHLAALDAVLLAARDIGELPLVVALRVRHRLSSPQTRAANVAGKVATVLQFATIAVVVVGAPRRRAWVLVTAAAGAVAALTYWAREARRPRP